MATESLASVVGLVDVVHASMEPSLDGDGKYEIDIIGEDMVAASMEPSLDGDGKSRHFCTAGITLQVLQWSRRSMATESLCSLTM